VKARKVKGLDPDAPTGQNAAEVVRTRLDELYSFIPAALDSTRVETLHDMRIAAKRLRYALEMTEPCFGAGARRGAAEARGLQGVLGEIHDCDELLPRVRRAMKTLRAEDVDALIGLAGADDLDPQTVRTAPNRARHRGLTTLIVYLEARRKTLFGLFEHRWAQLEAENYREAVEAALVAPSPTPAAEPVPVSELNGDPPDPVGVQEATRTGANGTGAS